MTQYVPEGALPVDAFASVGSRPFGIYVHVPWCSSRCGYCDFNTYVPGALESASPNTFVADAIAELGIARDLIGGRAVPVSTVFFGGGTPTLLPADDLVAVLDAIDSQFGLARGAEVTTEANPESVDAKYFDRLRSGGFTRVSLGMQSAASSVLATLDRVHTPGRAVDAARTARASGFDEVSLDLIYGAPGETDEQWRQSIEAALTADPTHISAYSLIVEQGTRMARQVSSGALFPADDDVLAHRYLMADDAFTDAGLEWYEVSNWARGGVDGSSFCRHNMGYWHNDDWWGVGPGAHSHVGNYRWWNHKHPGRCSASLAEGELPIAGSEALTQSDRELEDVMLRLRLAEGLPLDRVNSGQRHRVQELASDGLLDESQLTRGQLVLTRNGRLLADLVVRTLT
ncbi:MAG TPA: coproporphyrinogen III oxidase [Actinobacteria bacterium]|nr:coproporphyrinogen III oxidase [Actinomycetota bacterium]